MATPIAGTTRPASDEYAESYGGYISLVPEGDIVATLENQLASTLALLRSIDESQANKRYAPDKWSIKELVGHMIDSERIFGYRALRFARNDQTPLSGYEQDDYVRDGAFDNRALTDLANEFEHLRRANIYLFGSLDSDAYSRRGLANDVEVSVRALVYIIAGHEAHHMNVLKTRYLS